jgi:uncharacterized protein
MRTDITVITHHIKKGHNETFEKWLHEVIREASKFEGYQGINIIKPFNEDNEYTLTVRFAYKKNRMTWESSEIRKQWVSKLDVMILKQPEIHYEKGLEFWFSTPQHRANAAAPKWKMALLTWSAVFILISMLTFLINSFVPHMHLLVRLLSMTITMTLTLTYVIMPRITDLFSFWLFKKDPNTPTNSLHR